jgi:hypothetical protein
MTQSGSWSPYIGSEAVILTVVLGIITVVFAILGARLHRAIGVTRPGKAVAFFLCVLWGLSLVMYSNAVGVYIRAFAQQIASGQIEKITGASNPITPVTLTGVLVTFIVILVLSRRHGWKVALGSAIIGALAAPWIFELPFDLIIVGKVYTPLPALSFRGLYFLPLFLIEISTYSLLTFSPLVKLSRATLFSLSAMFLVFAIWAAFGFSYPFTPIPIALNAISKVLCFVAAITLFLPRKDNVAEENVSLGTPQTTN